MTGLIVCALSRLEATIAESGARSIVTLMRRDVRAMPGLRSGRHLWLEFSDITDPLDGYVLPGAAHLEALLDFALAWDRREPLLIHCYAGVSRSTAAAYVLACALDPGTSETDWAERLRDRSPTATPNARIVALADARLGRSGRMVEAIRRIGRGADCFEGEPFRLDIDSGAAAPAADQMPPYQS